LNANHVKFVTPGTEGTPLAALSAAGVSIWLDDLSRGRITSGSLARDVATSHIVGVTTNPSIFAASIGQSEDYDDQIDDLRSTGVSVGEAVRMMTTADVRQACDVLRSVYDATGRIDGRVSIEVDPSLARESEATIAEARQLWWLVDRPNVMIKIPATREGLTAIRAAIGAGISVNVTLIFSLARYAEVVSAYIGGLEDARDAGLDLARIQSVASFFVSRIDTEVDARLDARSPGSSLRGTAALASARLAYEHHQDVLASVRWKALAEHGASPQRPLWASTSVKDPQFPDTMYVTGLVAPGTVNTMPQATLEAVADHGVIPADSVTGTYDGARAALAALAEAGIDLDDVTRVLEDEGVEKFAKAWRTLEDGVASSLTA
jgi:transaldolase